MIIAYQANLKPADNEENYTPHFVEDHENKATTQAKISFRNNKYPNGTTQSKHILEVFKKLHRKYNEKWGKRINLQKYMHPL